MNYDVHCTAQGCYHGVYRDDVDSGWPAWNTGAFAARGGAVGTTRLDGRGRLGAPPLWHYTVPQSAELPGATCGPFGCGPAPCLARSQSPAATCRNTFCAPAVFAEGF